MTTSTANNTPRPLSMKSVGSSKTDILLLQCEIHGKYEGQVLHVSSSAKPIHSQCPVCKRERERQELLQQQWKLTQAKQRKLLLLTGYAGLPERFKERTFDNYHATTKEQLEALT